MRRQSIVSAMLLLFLLGVRDGYITLWKNGEAEPLRQFSYKAEYLPPPDRLALEKGILIEDQRELARILEDYLS